MTSGRHDGAGRKEYFQGVILDSSPGPQPVIPAAAKRRAGTHSATMTAVRWVPALRASHFGRDDKRGREFNAA